MAKYSFEVTLKNGDIRLVVPDKIRNGNLADFDKFVEEIGGTTKLEEYISDKLDITYSDIKSVMILGNAKQTHFALVSNNQYLTPVLNNLEVKTINIPGKYPKTTTTISTGNLAYQEMKKYLFDNLKSNYEHFLTQIYPLNNEFSRLLNSYGNAYKPEVYTEEEATNIKLLENKIAQELSIYKNYRGLCRYRTLNGFKQFQSPKKNVITNLDIKPSVKTKEPYTFDKEAEIAKQTEFYNQEYEEFLEPDEYEQMLGRNYN